MRHNNTASKNIGLSLLSAIASAGVTYFLFGTEKGAEQREKMKEWASETKNKIADTSDELKNVTTEVYNNMKVILKEHYGDIKALTASEKKELTSKIKTHWDLIKSDIETAIEQSKIDKGV